MPAIASCSWTEVKSSTRDRPPPCSGIRPIRGPESSSVVSSTARRAGRDPSTGRVSDAVAGNACAMRGLGETFFNGAVIAKYLPALLGGFRVTLALAAAVVTLGILLGLALAM